MSGIVGIVNLDGAPVDRDLLVRMTEFMAYRGPDAQKIWIDGNAGFGHTMLRTTFEAETETQPLTLDGKAWLTADARIDGRAELIAKLEARLNRKTCVPIGSHDHASSNGNGSQTRIPNDAELILLAYEAWGEDCVKHLIGDFAFAIWDAPQRRLFCARDHFGVKSFYYAHIGSTFIFSNTLNCVRLHPAVSDKLNERAIGDYLLFGINCDSTASAFADITRLSAATSLAISVDNSFARRYWSLSTDFQLSYKHSDNYPDEFQELLTRSVKDRLRTHRVSAELSGGIDSTSVVTTARKLMSGEASESLKAFTISYDRVIPDLEGGYADLVAATFAIPIQHIFGDGLPFFENTPKPEPFDVYPTSAIWTALLKEMAANSRVVLTGWDGDTWMNEEPRHYYKFLFKRGQLSRLVSAMWWFVKSQRSPPPIGVRTWLQKGRKDDQALRYPGWLNPQFEKRAELRDRWKQLKAEPVQPHPTRPSAFRGVSSTCLTNIFESYDAGVTSLPMEARHAITDVRVVEFLLRLPPVPWCVNKRIARAAMTDQLPQEILRRAKTPLGGDPAIGMVSNGALHKFGGDSRIMDYVEQNAVPCISRETDTRTLWTNSRPLGLDLWLRTIHC